MWHTAEQFRTGGYMPVESARINPAWTGDDVADLGARCGILRTLCEDVDVQQSEWWSNFSLGLDKGYDDQSYLWSDMLHYRATGQFGQQLWENAKKAGQHQNRQRAYALGYLTHLA